VSEDQAVTGEDRAVETSLADEVAKDYPFIQLMADIADRPVEDLLEVHRRVCELIGHGLTPKAAIAAHQEELFQRIEAGLASEGPVPA
jgi:hypothetical protein